MARHGSPRKYPRTARVNEVVREALAEEVERLSDPRLGLVTITGVDVSPDLRHATVYYSALVATGRRGGGQPVLTTSDDTRADVQDALKAAAPHLRAQLGRQVRLKYVPELQFRQDPAIEQGERVDRILRDLRRDEASD